MFELMFVGALFDIVFEKLRNFNILWAESAMGGEFTLFCQMEVIKILILELAIEDATKLAVAAHLLLLLLLRHLYLAQLVIDVLLHRHQNHRVQFLEVFHHCLLAVYWGKIGSHVVCPVLFSESYLLVRKHINQKVNNQCSLCDLHSSKRKLLQYLQLLYLFSKRMALECIQ